MRRGGSNRLGSDRDRASADAAILGPSRWESCIAPLWLAFSVFPLLASVLVRCPYSQCVSGLSSDLVTCSVFSVWYSVVFWIFDYHVELCRRGMIEFLCLPYHVMRLFGHNRWSRVRSRALGHPREVTRGCLSLTLDSCIAMMAFAVYCYARL